MEDFPIDSSGETLRERDVWQLIQSFDRGRNQNVLSQKYAKLRKNAFSFFRGTCHLFYQDLSATFTTSLAPVIWICGDLHLENFGTYKGDNRQIYFGINDFDEGALAPCTWDILRLLTSIFLAADSLNFDRADARKLVRTCLSSYVSTLAIGKIKVIDEATADGIVGTLIKNLRKRKRQDLLDERTERVVNRRHLKFDREKTLSISSQQFDRVNQAIENWAKSQPDPAFFEVLDVGFRVAGTGSLGLDRYLILVTGKGSPDRNYLLDFKQQPISALQPYLSEQPNWTNQATRVKMVQELVQIAPPALLGAIDFNAGSYLLRELQPTQDKITLKAGEISLAQLEKLIDMMGRVTASAHLHGSGQSGAAIAADLVDYGHSLGWQQDLLSYAGNYALQVQRDYQNFCQSTRGLREHPNKANSTND